MRDLSTAKQTVDIHVQKESIPSIPTRCIVPLSDESGDRAADVVPENGRITITANRIRGFLKSWLQTTVPIPEGCVIPV